MEDVDYSYVQFLHHDSSQVSHNYPGDIGKGHDYSYPKLVDCVGRTGSRLLAGGGGQGSATTSPKLAVRHQPPPVSSMLHNRYFLTQQNVMPDM